MNGNFLLAARLALRLRPGAAAAVIRSRKVRRTFLWALPLGAAALEVLELLLAPLVRGGNWGLAAGACAAIAALFWLGFALRTLFRRER